MLRVRLNAWARAFQRNTRYSYQRAPAQRRRINSFRHRRIVGGARLAAVAFASPGVHSVSASAACEDNRLIRNCRFIGAHRQLTATAFELLLAAERNVF